MTDDDLANRFGALLDAQDALCRGLEALADDLPDRLDTHLALTLSGRLHPTLRRSHLLEETLIFPVLMTARADLVPVLDRLHVEHFEDEDHAGDLHEVMTSFVARRTGIGAEAVGYMLRCMFISLRRHVAFDRDYTLPLYRTVARR